MIDALSEDAINQALDRWLRERGFETDVRRGHAHGIDIDARKGGERWVIEVKGRGSRPQMRVNFFLAVLGELLQRMDDDRARYSIALPDLPQYRALWRHLPQLAKVRTTITALFVNEDGKVNEEAGHD